MRSTLLALTALLVAPLPGAITFDSSFESGNGTNFFETSPGQYAFNFEPDTNSTDRQWFQFSVSGAQGQTLTFHLQGIDQSNVTGHWSLARPVASSDGGASWSPVTGSTMNTTSVFTFSHQMGGDPELIAFHYPYTHTMHASRMAQWSADPNVTASVIGTSVQGRDIDLLRITDAGFDLPGGKMGFWIVARQHAAEVTGSWMVDGLIDFLLSSDPRAVTLRRYVVINVVPMMNPDGVVAGNYRDNFNGYNLNREWNQATASNSPEVLAVVDEIDAWVTGGNRYEFFADLHSTSGGTDNFAFHASPGVEPPLYSNPGQYAADSDAFLQIVQANAPDFRWNTGNSSSTDQRLSRQHQTFQYGILAVLFEGTYNYPSYGPNSGQMMTPDRHRQIGEAFGIALHDWFLSSVPAILTGLSVN